MRLAAIWVGIPSALAIPEKVQLLKHSGARLLLTDPMTANKLSEVSAEAAVPPILTVDPHGSENDWGWLISQGHRAPKISIDAHAPAAIAYTSGTTGDPKGIVHSQRNLLLPGRVLTATRRYRCDLRKGDSLPLTILNLMTLTTLLTAQVGGCAVVMDRRDAIGVVEWIRRHRVTVWNGVPTQLRDLVMRSDIRRADLSSLSEVWCGGADLSESLRASFRAKFGLDPRATYGLTEAPAVVAIDPPGKASRAGCSGQVLPHLRVTVGAANSPTRLHDDPGELSISPTMSGEWRGCYSPMLGYWTGQGIEKTEGPLRTGDLGHLEEGGWLRVVDRKKLIILRGGANIYPAEVEHVLRNAPGVADAVVFGLPDQRLGQKVAALIEPDVSSAAAQELSIEELRRHCTARLARYKIPDMWALMDVLPRNAMGKVIRAELATVFAAAPRLKRNCGS